MNKVSDDTIIRTYGQLAQDLGRAPCARELARALGYTDWGSVRYHMDRLGLERHRMTHKERGQVRAQNEKAAREKGLSSYYDEINAADILLHRKLREIGGGPEVKPIKTLPAGYGYTEAQMLRVKCRICSKLIMIRPRTHPYYVRDPDGSVAWLCSAYCAGLERWKTHQDAGRFI